MKNFLTILLLGFCLFTQVVPVMASSSVDSTDFQAGMLPDQWDTKVQEAADFQHGEGDGLKQLQTLILDNVAQIFRYLLISIVSIYIFVDLMMLILGGSDESTIEKVKGNGGYYALGLLLVGLSSELVKVFDPAYLNGAIGNVAQAKSVFQTVINYIALISGSIAIFYMLVSAIRMITAQGDESIIDEEKKDFQYGFLGLVVIIMADVIINKVFYPADIQAPAGQETTIFAEEIFAMAAYFLEFLAVVSIASVVLAGGYYVISLGDEEQTSQAKTILKNLAIGFIMIAFAYTVVSAVSPNLAGQVFAR